MEDNKFPREVSLCLSGGAAKGAFHLGAIHVLEQNNVKIKAISGTSIGALIGASLASGKNSVEIFKILKSREFKKVFKLSIGSGYLFEIDTESDVIKQLIPSRTFKELEFPLEVAICDIDSPEVLYKNSGDLYEVVLASCALTPVFKPVKINDKLFTDGGVIDNFPVQRLKKYGYPIVGINLFPNRKNYPTSILGWIKKVFFVAWQVHNLNKEKECEIFLSCDELHDVSAFTFKDFDKAFDLGVEKMSKLIKKQHVNS